ncbi:MAG: bifunctional phosphoribosylaminoimidazolecarboxamide formyltransferase/IMP cyclohydrolase [Vampirovibrionia bacterium]
MKEKKALISVSNKENLTKFASILTEKLNYKLYSTGGTLKALQEANIECFPIDKLTNHPEILDGRVKTLHPKVHGGILANRNIDKHLKELNDNNIELIDLVIVNLYPFEKVAQNENASIEDLIENIDIGGPTLIRSSAKNYKDVTVVCSPSDYEKIASEMEENEGNTTLKTRQQLALKAFNHTYNYDSMIFKTLSEKFNHEQMTEDISLNLTKVQELRYGENPHQKAALYKDSNIAKDLPYKVLQGKELSYNNLVDITQALKITNEFKDVPAACIIKHANPCGVAVGKTHFEAYNKALSCDPISAFGGIISINGEVNKDIAETITSMFIEVVIATNYTEEAKALFTKKKNVRLIEIDPDKDYFNNNVIKEVVGGILIQETDTKMITKDDFNVVSKIKPSEAEIDDLLFAWKVAKHVSSNAIVIAKNGKTLGIGCGQTSRIASMEIALRQACDEAKGAVVASDGFFPAIDNIQAAAQSRVSSIIQPGGSIKDKDVIETVDKLELSMVCTGNRHFKH